MTCRHVHAHVHVSTCMATYVWSEQLEKMPEGGRHQMESLGGHELTLGSQPRSQHYAQEYLLSLQGVGPMA